MVGSGRNQTSCPQGTAFTARRRHQPVLMALPVFGCGPRGCTGPSRLMRPRGFLTDLPAQMVRGLSTPSLAAGTSAVSRNGGCLTCRSPHLAVPSRFERAPEAALVRHPCGGRPRSRSAVANHPIAFQAMPIARSVDLPYWRMAEHSKPMPCGTIGVQSRAGEPCRFTIPVGLPDRSRTYVLDLRRVALIR